MHSPRSEKPPFDSMHLQKVRGTAREREREKGERGEGRGDGREMHRGMEGHNQQRLTAGHR